ncbi:toxin-antitoxin system YwqK family antitoxin [Dyadobacter sp. LJ53]|uniref:toxin-antitoxin system YwqK family antitoxin n=1 Tax=Dyadobacter chenwenxiniae TaxID=2906456 RepID=UPI001F42AE79|nr:toxin-antitoxin system YwqK family antitoxin [Dyadobacter chenwenxiniae]MCF0049544.1 toxin-antitoxin system YwqK family antitoxin [Dyadobacter chenwenxiniae]
MRQMTVQTIRELFAEGQIFKEYELLDTGVCHGSFKQWYENGQISLQIRYKYGKENGEMLSWYRNGQLRSKVFYNNGTEQGITKTWHENGKIHQQRPMQNGLLHGVVQTFDANGKETREYFVNGKNRNFQREEAGLMLDFLKFNSLHVTGDIAPSSIPDLLIALPYPSP